MVPGLLSPSLQKTACSMGFAVGDCGWPSGRQAPPSPAPQFDMSSRMPSQFSWEHVLLPPLTFSMVVGSFVCDLSCPLYGFWVPNLHCSCMRSPWYLTRDQCRHNIALTVCKRLGVSFELWDCTIPLPTPNCTPVVKLGATSLFILWAASSIAVSKRKMYPRIGGEMHIS